MKEAPTDTSPSTQNTSPSRSSPTARPIWKRALLLVVGAPVVLLLYVILQSLFTSSEEPEIAAGGRVRAIQLDVLNGSGEAKLAQRMTDFLRARGFDVVEMGNYPSSDVEATV
ncbi:MAG TPA: LytR C-terminal domain-containing protein, partial [Bacteroidota bacterium]